MRVVEEGAGMAEDDGEVREENEDEKENGRMEVEDEVAVGTKGDGVEEDWVEGLTRDWVEDFTRAWAGYLTGDCAEGLMGDLIEEVEDEEDEEEEVELDELSAEGVDREYGVDKDVGREEISRERGVGMDFLGSGG